MGGGGPSFPVLRLLIGASAEIPPEKIPGRDENKKKCAKSGTSE